MPHFQRGFIPYTPTKSGWAAMSIKADQYTAANNGATLTVSPPNDNFWPLHHGDLRAVYGLDTGSKKDSCVATNPTGSLFVLGASFSDMFGNAYTVTGLRQERFNVAHLK